MSTPWPLLLLLSLLFAVPNITELKKASANADRDLFAEAAPGEAGTHQTDCQDRVNASLEAYLESDADELRQRGGTARFTYINDLVSCLEGLPSSDDTEGKLEYFRAVKERMEGEAVMDSDTGTATASFKKALDHLNAAAALVSNQPYIANERGIVFQLQGNYNDAKNIFDSLTNDANTKDWALPYVNLANVYQLIDTSSAGTTAAQRLYEESLKKTSGLAIADLGLGNIKLATSVTDGLSMLQTAYQNLGEASEIQFGYARALMKNGDQDTTEALRIYQEILDDPEGTVKGNVHYARGYYYQNEAYPVDDTTASQNYKATLSFPGNNRAINMAYQQLGLIYRYASPQGQGASRRYLKSLIDGGKANDIPTIYASYIYLEEPNTNGLLNPLNQQDYLFFQRIMVSLYQFGALDLAQEVAKWAVTKQRFRTEPVAHFNYIDILFKNKDTSNAGCHAIANALKHLDPGDFKAVICCLGDQDTARRYYIEGLGCQNFSWPATCQAGSCQTVFPDPTK